MQIVDHFGNGLIRTRDPENVGIDIIFILLSHTVSEQGLKNEIFAMAALICILLKTLKDAKVTPSRLLISTLE